MTVTVFANLTLFSVFGNVVKHGLECSKSPKSESCEPVLGAVLSHLKRSVPNKGFWNGNKIV